MINVPKLEKILYVGSRCVKQPELFIRTRLVIVYCYGNDISNQNWDELSKCENCKTEPYLSYLL